MTNEVTKGKSYAGNPRTRFGSIACAGAMALFAFLAQAKTVAYWPMVMNPATGGDARKIADASGNNYDLNVLLTDTQAVNADEIPFAHPPNGPADVTVANCVEIIDGTTIVSSVFTRGTGSQAETTKDPLVLALGLNHDFTLEGYMYVKTLKHGDKADTVIAFSGVNGTGDWIWNLTEPTANSNTRQVILATRNGDGLSSSGVLATIEDREIVGGWHHYALVFNFDASSDKSQCTFYLDGANRGSQTMKKRSSVTQHDRFALGGIGSNACKAFDAKFAFWRVSDEALSPDAMLCKVNPGTTVAYWPMKVVSAYYDNAKQTIVPDLISGRNALIVRDPTKGGVSWSMNDIGWTTPLNPDAEVKTLGIDSRSTMKVVSGNNTTKIDDQYRAVFSTVADAPIIEATKLTNGFTIEGFLKFATLPASNDKNQMFVYNTLGENGGWVWNLYGPDGNGNLSVKVISNHNGDRPAVTLGSQFRAEELLNVWNHYALTFTPDNGKGETEWRFYLNGHLRGKSNSMSAYGSYNFNSPTFNLSGVGSGGNPQALQGDMTCWRISNRALQSAELLCGSTKPIIPADALVWRGASDSAEWSTGNVANWTASGFPVAWTDAKDAYFDDSFATNIISIAGEVNPASINVLADSNLKVVFDKSSVIGEGCRGLAKWGFGTLEFSYGGNEVMNLLKGACPIDVREGCLKITAVNSNGGLGDASLGYEVKIYDHATLRLNGRNAIGSSKAGDVNESVFAVYTNGTFNMSCDDGTLGIQALGCLDLLGGDFVAPSKCHGLGYLLVRDRLTLGLRPDKKAYVFPAVKHDGGIVEGGITIGTNTEFRVEDITSDAAPDAVFNCAVMARTRDGWQSATNPCRFRKTGDGTMELNSNFRGGTQDQAKPSGVIAVESGELRINVDYRGPVKYAVAGGAFLSGTGKVSTVEFATGAGLRVNASATSMLELEAADFAESGVVEISGVPTEDIENLKVGCARIIGAVTGAANLRSWTVKVNGAEMPSASVRFSGGILKASIMKGTVIVVR